MADPVAVMLLLLALRDLRAGDPPVQGSRPPSERRRASPGAGTLTREVDRRGVVRYYGRVLRDGVLHRTPRVRVTEARAEKAAEKQARADLKALVARLARGAVPDPRTDRTTLGAWVQAWLAAKEREVEASSYESYEALLRLHVVPYLGHLVLSAIRPPAVLAWRSALERDGRSADRIRKAETVLRLALKDAGASELAVSDAVPAMRRVRVKRTPRPHVTEAQFLRLLEHAPEPWTTVYCVAFYGMLRDGELRGLDWRHVLWTSNQIDTAQQVDRRRNERAPKKGSSGVVDVPKEVLDLLARHRERTEQALGRPVAPDDPVFTGRSGRRWSHEWPRTVLKRHLAAAGLPADLTWHSFRRGGATAHSAEAVDPFTLQQLMRHSSLAVTQTYLRPVVRGGKQAAERVARRVRHEAPGQGS